MAYCSAILMMNAIGNLSLRTTGRNADLDC
jgi:hypothetical protein